MRRSASLVGASPEGTAAVRERPRERRCTYRPAGDGVVGATCRSVEAGPKGRVAEVHPDPDTGLPPVAGVPECAAAGPGDPCWSPDPADPRWRVRRPA